MAWARMSATQAAAAIAEARREGYVGDGVGELFLSLFTEAMAR